MGGGAGKSWEKHMRAVCWVITIGCRIFLVNQTEKQVIVPKDTHAARRILQGKWWHKTNPEDEGKE